MKLTILLLLFALGGCQTGAKAFKCGGRAFALNPEHWQPVARDVKACSATVPGQ